MQSDHEAMARPCGICNHMNRSEIELGLESGQSIRVVAARFWNLPFRVTPARHEPRPRGGLANQRTSSPAETTHSKPMCHSDRTGSLVFTAAGTGATWA